MSRRYSTYLTNASKENLALLVKDSTNHNTYSNAMYLLGKELGNVLSAKIDRTQRVCVACSVEDTDFLAKGIIEILTNNLIDVSLACFWNRRQPNLSIAPILRKYQEPNVNNAKILIVVKSVISSACVVKTNLTNLIQKIEPDIIFVVAPVIYKDAPLSLRQEFPEYISNKFQYIYFAEDSIKRENGELCPGIGGNVYQRLGFKDQDDKNRTTPNLVKERRATLSMFLRNIGFVFVTSCFTLQIFAESFLF